MEVLNSSFCLFYVHEFLGTYYTIRTLLTKSTCCPAQRMLEFLQCDLFYIFQNPRFGQTCNAELHHSMLTGMNENSFLME